MRVGGALVALFEMAAERCGAAALDGPQGTQLLQRQAMSLLVGRTVLSNNVGQLQS